VRGTTGPASPPASWLAGSGQQAASQAARPGQQSSQQAVLLMILHDMTDC